MATDISGLQKEVFSNKQKRGFNTTDVGKEIILMTEELGELAKAYKKSNKKAATEIDNRDEIIDAVGDLTVYCLGLCEMLNIDSGEMLKKIIESNRTRTHSGKI